MSQIIIPCDSGEVSDGYHSFDELYAALCYNVGMTKRLTFEQFVEKAKQVHGEGKFAYPKQKYANNKTKIKIFCFRCNQEFQQNPSTHLLGKGCHLCRHSRRRTPFALFLNQARAKHGNDYEYSDEYKSALTKIGIFCKRCNATFYQTPSIHINGSGCPECGKAKAHKNTRKSFHSFADQASQIHQNKYIYDESDYVDRRTKTKIFCSVCQVYFLQKPNHHLLGSGCPHCCHHSMEGTRQGCVYKITCVPTGQTYIGITTTPIKRRLSRHFDTARRRKVKSPLAKAILEYGSKVFTIEEIEKGFAGDLGKLEEKWIKETNSRYPNGFNVGKGGLGLHVKKSQFSHSTEKED